MFGGEYEKQEGIGNCFERDWCRPAQVVTNCGFNAPAGAGNGQPNFVRNDGNAGFWMTTGGVVAGNESGRHRATCSARAEFTFDESGNAVAYTPGSLVSGTTQIGGNIAADLSQHESHRARGAATRCSRMATSSSTDNMSAFVEASYGYVTGSVLQSSFFDAGDQRSAATTRSSRRTCVPC